MALHETKLDVSGSYTSSRAGPLTMSAPEALCTYPAHSPGFNSHAYPSVPFLFGFMLIFVGEGEVQLLAEDKM